MGRFLDRPPPAAVRLSPLTLKDVAPRAWDGRLARWLVTPLRDTRVHPNHVTTFGTLVGLLLAPPSLLYQDVARGVTMLVGAWFFITPVVYPLPASGRYTTVIRLNPVTPLLVTTRELATTGVVSDPVGFLWWSLVTVVGLAAAWLGFRLALPFVLERVGP